jgi:D-glycero-D-manno-heptose 1,7-bisphosphate phosphatase
MNQQAERMQAAVFLDRDGVLNKELGMYVTSHELLEVLPHVPPLLRRLQDAGFLLVVITNQGGIAKGLYTHGDLELIHAKLATALEQEGVQLTGLYYCPHHPDFTQCLCRKPGSLLIEKAMARYSIDPARSWMIGDRERDLQAAAAAGVSSFLVESNADWSDLLDRMIP